MSESDIKLLSSIPLLLSFDPHNNNKKCSQRTECMFALENSFFKNNNKKIAKPILFPTDANIFIMCFEFGLFIR